jgi:ATP-dependent DNA ligase
MPLLKDIPKRIDSVKEKPLPFLFKRTKNGNIAYYKIVIRDYEDHSVVTTTKASKIGAKEQSDAYEVWEGVNIGKANETTVVEQAERIALTSFNAKKDEGYKTFQDLDLIVAEDTVDLLKAEKTLRKYLPKENTDAQGNIKPMLAGAYNQDKHIDYPYYAQPKYDGMRCLVFWQGQEVVLLSRAGKPLNIPHIKKELEKHLPKGTILDGELYNHDELSFQEVISACKRVTEQTSLLQYVVYDTVNEKPFKLRITDLVNLFDEKNFNKVVLSPTQVLKNKADLVSYHSKVAGKQKYEGVMLRHMEGKYEKGARSNHLLKYKHFEDAEFKIVGFEEANGRDAGTIIFVCETNEGKRFNCRPEGTREVRTKWFKQGNRLIGKQLTVKFQGLSDDGIPRFPVGKIIRNY